METVRPRSGQIARCGRQVCRATHEPAATRRNALAPVPSLAAEPPCCEAETTLRQPRIRSTCRAEVKGEEIAITLGDRRYRVRGLAKNLSYAMLRSTCWPPAETASTSTRSISTRPGSAPSSSSRRRSSWAQGRRASRRPRARAAEARGAAGRADPEGAGTEGSPTIAISDEERAAALDLLKDPRLLDRILDDFERLRRRGRGDQQAGRLPRGRLAQARSAAGGDRAVQLAAGKSSLMDAVLAFVPEEERVKYSAMTGQSLFYMGETDLKHKVLAIVEEEGASARSLRAEAAAERGRADDRLHRQGPGDRPPGDAGVPRRGAGDDLPDHDGDRARRGAAEPLPGADRQRGPRADAGDPPAAARAQTLEGLLARAGARSEILQRPPQRAAAA